MCSSTLHTADVSVSKSPDLNQAGCRFVLDGLPSAGLSASRGGWFAACGGGWSTAAGSGSVSPCDRLNVTLLGAITRLLAGIPPGVPSMGSAAGDVAGDVIGVTNAGLPGVPMFSTRPGGE